jgi:hypothetical protein
MGVESQLQSDLLSEVSRAQAAELSVAGAAQAYTDAETSRALAAEGSIASALAVETSRALAAEASVQAADQAYTDAETSRALAAEGSIASALAAEVSRAQAQEASISSALVVETSRAMAAEGVLLGDITTETSRAQGVEAALDARVTALEAAYYNFAQQRVELSATDISNGYIDLAHAYGSDSLQLHVDRLALYEGDDYTLAVIGGVTRVTFIGSLVVSGQEQLVAGDVIHVRGAYISQVTLDGGTV